MRKRKKSTHKSALKHLRSHLSEIVAQHLRAVHLPHVRRYHARIKSRPREGMGELMPDDPKERFALPLYLVDLSRLESLAGAIKHEGWLHFLEWRNGLLGIAETDDSAKPRNLARVSIGPSADAESSVVAKFLKSKVPHKGLACIAVPSLHFRALSYIDKKTDKLMVVPLSSPVVRLQRGRRYTSITVQEKLQAALDFRLKAAREHQIRQARLSETDSNQRRRDVPS